MYEVDDKQPAPVKPEKPGRTRTPKPDRALVIETLPFGWQREKTRLLERSARLLDSEHLSDVTFFVGLWPGSGVDLPPKKALTRFAAHKLLLSTASPVFEELFSGTFLQRSEVFVTDVHPDDFRLLLR